MKEELRYEVKFSVTKEVYIKLNETRAINGAVLLIALKSSSRASVIASPPHKRMHYHFYLPLLAMLTLQKPLIPKRFVPQQFQYSKMKLPLIWKYYG